MYSTGLFAAAFLVLYGCVAYVPLKERQDAEEMLNTAATVDANVYAPGEYSRALENFFLAKIEMEKKQYKKAQDYLEMSMEDSRVAIAKSQAAKAIKSAKEILDTSNLAQLKKYITDVCAIAEKSLERAKTAFEDQDYNVARQQAEMSLQLSKELPRLMEQKIIEEGKKSSAEIERKKAIEESKKILEEAKKEATAIAEGAKKEAATILARELEKRFPSVYTVKKGDTLHVIAGRREIYNDPYQWPLIYKANRDQIRDPLQIFLGQSLIIPRAVTIDEIIEARRQAGAPAPDVLPPEAFSPEVYK